MALLDLERATLDRLLPDLDATLSALPLSRLEQRGGPAISIFRDHAGPSLLVPTPLGGKGASPVEAVQAHRALGARAPSLSIAATMHNFSVATFVEYDAYGEEGRAVLQAVGAKNLLIASGFAEGRSGTDIFDATMRAEPTSNGYLVSGSKKPCSLSRSMNLLTAGVRVLVPDGPPRRAIALVRAEASGIERRPFWNTDILAGAESDELILDRVFVPTEHVLFPMKEEELDVVELGGLCWFQLLITASYLGIASSLAERALKAPRRDTRECVRLGIELEGAMSALEGAAAWMERRHPASSVLPRTLLVRFAVQSSIERATALAAELLGGMAFIQSQEVGYLLAASRALAFHPPPRLKTIDTLASYLDQAGRVGD
jgi:alkylation response protein AidB-like acyl-CoA dehydrogenase